MKDHPKELRPLLFVIIGFTIIFFTTLFLS